MATERRPRKRAASSRTTRTTSATRARTSSTARRKTTRKPATRKPAKSAARPLKRAKAPKTSTVKLPEQVATAISAALDKKAEHIQVLDLRKGSAFTDFFIIATGNNIRQVQAIANGIEETLKKDDVRPALVEGYSKGDWILLDYFDFIVHIFTPATREFYALERLWGDAERVEVSA